MKNTNKFLGIIAIMAIAVSTMACPNPTNPTTEEIIAGKQKEVRTALNNWMDNTTVVDPDDGPFSLGVPGFVESELRREIIEPAIQGVKLDTVVADVVSKSISDMEAWLAKNGLTIQRAIARSSHFAEIAQVRQNADKRTAKGIV